MEKNNTMKNKNKNKNKKIKIKILTLGNGNVGKTSFIYKFAENYFETDTLSTTGIDNLVANIKMPNGKEYPVNFCDTAGQERYRSMALSVIKKTDGIILMYDITDKSSFESIPSWMEQIEENKGLKFPIILCGNKCDLEEERVISKEEGEKLAKKLGINFFEMSCQNEINLKTVGYEIINQIVNKKEKEKNDILKDFLILEKDSFQLDENDLKKRSKTSQTIKKTSSKCL